jgi:hypothetical protein
MQQRFSNLKSGLALGIAVATGAASSAWAITEMSWDKVNAPQRLMLLNGQFDQRFDETGKRVPFSARLPDSRIPYADTYWPSNRGGIAYRWNASNWLNPYLLDMTIHHPYQLPTQADRSRMDDGGQSIFDELSRLTPANRQWIINKGKADVSYRSPSRTALMKMTREELARLSPTEKYDLVRGIKDQRGEYIYTFTRRVLGARNIGATRAYWEGICHGWAPASINHAEPMPVDVTNPDGIVIPFGSADVKAMLDYRYAYPEDSGVNQLGYRCDDKLSEKGNWGRGKCGGVNAGAFHVALTNYIGLRHTAFIADAFHGDEVWNNAVYAYDFKVVEKRNGTIALAAPGTVRSVLIHATVKFPSDDERFGPQWDATVGREEVLVPEYGTPITAEFRNKLNTGFRYDVGEYDYWLDLGKDDVILGGSWAGFDRPDYLWIMPKQQFTGEFAALARIYRPAYKR